MRRGIPLIVAATILALLSILFCGCGEKEQTVRIGILQWTEEIDSFRRTCQGVIDGLEAKGYKQGINLVIGYRNAEQDGDLALRIAEDFVEEGVELIISLGTGSSLAALKATEEKRIPIVYSIVAKPRTTGIIKEYNDSGRNITGVTMKVPVEEQFALLKEVLPPFERLGILYCTQMPQAVAGGEEAAAITPSFGWIPVTAFLSKEELPQLHTIVASLARQVDVIYLPPDPVRSLPENRRIILAVADQYDTPVVAEEEAFVREGALMAVHCDFYEIGRQAANLAAQALAGVDVRKISSQRPIVKRLSLNLRKAQKLRIDIKRNVILKADTLFE